jgi:hypothetical protein
VASLPEKKLGGEGGRERGKEGRGGWLASAVEKRLCACSSFPFLLLPCRLIKHTRLFLVVSGAFLFLCGHLSGRGGREGGRAGLKGVVQPVDLLFVSVQGF